MDADAILARLDDGSQIPADWTVIPIIRRRLIVNLLEWAFGIIIGGGLFAVIAPIVIPYNYTRSFGLAAFSTILLAICLFIALASLYLLVVDIVRLRNADRYRIVLTPQDFLMQEGNKVTYVPMASVDYVTARGKPQAQSTMPTEEESATANVPGIGENVSAFFFGRGMTKGGRRWRRNRMRTPASVAFIDSRHNKEVLVINDTAFGDPYAIGTVLKEYAAAAHEEA